MACPSSARPMRRRCAGAACHSGNSAPGAHECAHLPAEGRLALNTAASIAQEAGIDAVIGRHLDRFVEVIERTFASDQYPIPKAASIAVGEAFVEYYRAEPGFRAIWFGPGFTGRHRQLDLENNKRLARTMYEQLTRHGLIPNGELSGAIVISNWEIADTLTGLAFRVHPDGDEMILGYLRYVMTQIAKAPPLDVTVHLAGLRAPSAT